MKFSFASIVDRRPFEGSRARACAATIGVPIIGTMSTSIAEDDEDRATVVHFLYSVGDRVVVI